MLRLEPKQSHSQGGSWDCLELAQEASQPTSKGPLSRCPERLSAKFNHGYNLVTSFEVPKGPGHHCQFQSYVSTVSGTEEVFDLYLL